VSTSEQFGVREHLERFWPDRAQEDFAWALGPVEERIPGFRVRRIAPASPGEPWVYVTVGASVVQDGDGMEFFILSPAESPRHVETLAMVATFHADPANRLSAGSTIRVGRPWLDGSSADHLLVSLPYPYGPALEHCDAADRHVQILWLVPVTAAEARLVQEHGAEALEELLERSNVDVIAPTRRSLV
jgi:hypothetical protein